MFNLFDIMQNEGGGTHGFGQQFGLSPDQTRRAMEALLPALTIGLQRNAIDDPAGLGQMFGLVGPGTGARPDPTGQADLLGRLFGSPALAQAVLQQAASTSGIGTQALRQMLPAMAGMVVAGIVHVMLNQPPPAQPAQRQAKRPLAADFPAGGFWDDWMNTFLSSPAASPSPAPRGSSTGAEGRPQAGPAPDKRDAEEATLSAPKAGTEPSTDVFQQMFQSGVEVHDQNVKAVQDLFDSFWAPRRAGEAKAPDPSAEGEAVGPAPATSKPKRRPKA